MNFMETSKTGPKLVIPRWFGLSEGGASSVGQMNLRVLSIRMLSGLAPRIRSPEMNEYARDKILGKIIWLYDEYP